MLVAAIRETHTPQVAAVVPVRKVRTGKAPQSVVTAATARIFQRLLDSHLTPFGLAAAAAVLDVTTSLTAAKAVKEAVATQLGILRQATEKKTPAAAVGVRSQVLALSQATVAAATSASV